MSTPRLLAILATLSMVAFAAGCGCPDRAVSHFSSLTCATSTTPGAFTVTPSTDLGNVSLGSSTTCVVSANAGVVSLTLNTTACPLTTTAPSHAFITASCAVGPLAAGTWSVDGAQVTVFADGGVDLSHCAR